MDGGVCRNSYKTPTSNSLLPWRTHRIQIQTIPTDANIHQSPLLPRKHKLETNANNTYKYKRPPITAPTLENKPYTTPTIHTNAAVHQSLLLPWSNNRTRTQTTYIDRNIHTQTLNKNSHKYTYTYTHTYTHIAST